jgi:tRNA threonylcarbamoyladenosine biosynthesis protein TsaE
MSLPQNETFVVTCSDESATDNLGASIAESMTDGIVIELNGQLGAGKTRLVRAICGSLGIDTNQVNSPTFVLLQLYTDGRIPVAHFDTYRLGDIDEFLAIGADEFTQSSEWLCLIEWAERVDDCLPADRLRINISAITADSRRFEFSSFGLSSARLLQRIKENESRSRG